MLQSESVTVDVFHLYLLFSGSFVELQQQKAHRHSPLLKREQEAVRFCDQLPSNTVVLNHLDPECVLCLWVDRLSVLTPVKLSQRLHFIHQHLLPSHVAVAVAELRPVTAVLLFYAESIVPK